MFIGELVKVAIGVREEERLISGRWVIVESISHTDSGLQAVGRSWWQHCNEDFCITFGPESIYRMESRRFYLWGSGGIPIAMRTGSGPEERMPALPIDAQEQYIEGCENVILEFTALGSRSAETSYRDLALQNAHWPDFDDLK